MLRVGLSWDILLNGLGWVEIIPNLLVKSCGRDGLNPYLDGPLTKDESFYGSTKSLRLDGFEPIFGWSVN